MEGAWKSAGSCRNIKACPADALTERNIYNIGGTGQALVPWLASVPHITAIRWQRKGKDIAMPFASFHEPPSTARANVPDHTMRPLKHPGPGLWDNRETYSTPGAPGTTRPPKPARFEETPAKHVALKAIVRVLSQAAAAVFRDRDPKKRSSKPPDLENSIRPRSPGPVTAMIFASTRITHQCYQRRRPGRMQLSWMLAHAFVVPRLMHDCEG